MKLNETQQETEKLMAKEGIEKQMNEYRLNFVFFLVENIKNHEENVRQSNDIANTIREKVIELIDKIKQEEKKLIHNIQEFNNTERRLIKEKNIRLQDLTKIQTFCSISQDKLHR